MAAAMLKITKLQEGPLRVIWPLFLRCFDYMQHGRYSESVLEFGWRIWESPCCNMPIQASLSAIRHVMRRTLRLTWEELEPAMPPHSHSGLSHRVSIDLSTSRSKISSTTSRISSLRLPPMADSAGKMYALASVLSILATVAIMLRLYARRIKQTALLWDDYAILLALVHKHRYCTVPYLMW